jgi:signal transduction histidine kinase
MVVPIHLLVCDADPDDALAIVARLRHDGLDVAHERAEDRRAVAAALHGGPPDVVISDYSLPSCTAWDTLRMLRDAAPDVPFILVSAEIDSSRATALMRAGARDFVGKHDLSRLTPVVQRELRQAECRRRLARLESLGTLAGGIAHDFNNLLTVIRGHTELALDTMPRDVPGRADLERVQHAAERGEALARLLLVPGERESGRRRAADPNAVVDEAVRLLGPVLDRGVELVTQLEPGLPAVGLDPGSLEHALLNVLINAGAAMPDGGRITVETARTGAGVRLTVSDTGYGMPAEVVERAFEPYFTTKGHGIGLGLASVCRAVQEAGGTASLASEPGAGTTVRIDLPAAPRFAGH